MLELYGDGGRAGDELLKQLYLLSLDFCFQHTFEYPNVKILNYFHSHCIIHLGPLLFI